MKGALLYFTLLTQDYPIKRLDTSPCTVAPTTRDCFMKRTATLAASTRAWARTATATVTYATVAAIAWHLGLLPWEELFVST